MKKGKAKKKPVEIDWFLWEGQIDPLKDWINSLGENPEEIIEVINNTTIRVKTLEGTSYSVPFGYTIIRGVEGEYYPCESKIFKKTYECS